MAAVTAGSAGKLDAIAASCSVCKQIVRIPTGIDEGGCHAEEMKGEWGRQEMEWCNRRTTRGKAQGRDWN